MPVLTSLILAATNVGIEGWLRGQLTNNMDEDFIYIDYYIQLLEKPWNKSW